MKYLPDPINDEFEKQCHWVLSKPSSTLPATHNDQAHEQGEAYYVKGALVVVLDTADNSIQVLGAIRAARATWPD